MHVSNKTDNHHTPHCHKEKRESKHIKQEKPKINFTHPQHSSYREQGKQKNKTKKPQRNNEPRVRLQTRQTETIE